MIKAPLACDAVGPNPEDWGENGSKRHLLVDGRGASLSSVVTGAHRHGVSQLERVLDAIVMDRLKGRQHLCADKGYSGEPAQQAVNVRKYIPHVKQRGQEIQDKKTNPRRKARHWVVEIAHSWLNFFWKLLVRYEKNAESYDALLQMAAALIAIRRQTSSVKMK